MKIKKEHLKLFKLVINFVRLFDLKFKDDFNLFFDHLINYIYAKQWTKNRVLYNDFGKNIYVFRLKRKILIRIINKVYKAKATLKKKEKYEKFESKDLIQKKVLNLIDLWWNYYKIKIRYKFIKLEKKERAKFLSNFYEEVSNFYEESDYFKERSYFGKKKSIISLYRELGERLLKKKKEIQKDLLEYSDTFEKDLLDYNLNLIKKRINLNYFSVIEIKLKSYLTVSDLDLVSIKKEEKKSEVKLEFENIVELDENYMKSKELFNVMFKENYALSYKLIQEIKAEELKPGFFKSGYKGESGYKSGDVESYSDSLIELADALTKTDVKLFNQEFWLNKKEAEVQVKESFQKLSDIYTENLKKEKDVIGHYMNTYLSNKRRFLIHKEINRLIKVMWNLLKPFFVLLKRNKKWYIYYEDFYALLKKKVKLMRYVSVEGFIRHFLLYKQVVFSDEKNEITSEAARSEGEKVLDEEKGGSKNNKKIIKK